MRLVKTEEEIELLRLNGDLVSRALAEVARSIRPGITTLALDRLAEAFVRDHGAQPGFLGYNGYPHTLCVSVNDTVVHGLPSQYQLQEGDIVSVDCGTLMHGYYGDSAFTFAVGPVAPPVATLLRVTRECLDRAIGQARAGQRVGDIAHAVQRHAEAHGFGVVRELVGHGLGRSLHEKPEVPNAGTRGRGSLLAQGMVLCIEPMINGGTRHVYQDPDGWAIRTQDGKPSAHFELTVVVREGAPEVISTFRHIDQILGYN